MKVTMVIVVLCLFVTTEFAWASPVPIDQTLLVGLGGVEREGSLKKSEEDTTSKQAVVELPSVEVTSDDSSTTKKHVEPSPSTETSTIAAKAEASTSTRSSTAKTSEDTPTTEKSPVTVPPYLYPEEDEDDGINPALCASLCGPGK